LNASMRWSSSITGQVHATRCYLHGACRR
jgi:hypothetical protein